MSDLVETALRNLFHRQQAQSEVDLHRPSRVEARSSTSGTETLSTKPWKGDDRVVVVDTNILVYAAHVDF